MCKTIIIIDVMNLRIRAGDIGGLGSLEKDIKLCKHSCHV